MTRLGDVVRVFIGGRSDFVRRAQVLAIDDDMLLVRYVDYDLPDEWIPARWL